MSPQHVELYSLLLKQDDPKKCTSAKLSRLRVLKPIYSLRQIPKSAILLNPMSASVFSAADGPKLNFGLVVIDCSWKRISDTFNRSFPGQHRRLPLLLAANPTNYGHLSTLSSAEALAASLYVAGFEEQARLVVSKFKWGPTFLTLNHDPLEDYRKAKNQEEITQLEKAYFPSTSFKGY